jgi:hypothetical protein
VYCLSGWRNEKPPTALETTGARLPIQGSLLVRSNQTESRCLVQMKSPSQLSLLARARFSRKLCMSQSVGMGTDRRLACLSGHKIFASE